MSLKVLNDEAEITSAIAAVRELAPKMLWALDIVGTHSELLVALQTAACQQVSTPLAASSRRMETGVPGLQPQTPAHPGPGGRHGLRSPRGSKTHLITAAKSGTEHAQAPVTANVRRSPPNRCLQTRVARFNSRFSGPTGS